MRRRKEVRQRVRQREREKERNTNQTETKKANGLKWKKIESKETRCIISSGN